MASSRQRGLADEHLFRLAACYSSPLAAFSPRRLIRLEWIWFIGFGWLALSGLRYVIWFMFIMAVLQRRIAHRIEENSNTSSLNSNPKFNYALGAVLLFLPFMMLPGIRESWWQDAPPPYHQATTPIAATEWLAAHPDLPGPLFAEYTFGSYLTFALPSRLLWIDNRFNAYPPEHWENYQAITSAEPRLGFCARCRQSQSAVPLASHPADACGGGRRVRFSGVSNTATRTRSSFPVVSQSNEPLFRKTCHTATRAPHLPRAVLRPARLRL